jgi:hypothetical protein
VALPFTLKSILRSHKKKNKKKTKKTKFVETQIFHHEKKYIILKKIYNLPKKNPLKETKILQEIIITL